MYIYIDSDNAIIYIYICVYIYIIIVIQFLKNILLTYHLFYVFYFSIFFKK